MMNRSFYTCLMMGAALSLGACVGPDANLDMTTGGLTPLSRYMLQVEPGQDRIALAVRTDVLSSNQQSAVAALAGRYRASGAERLLIEVVDQTDSANARMVGYVVRALETQGVARHQIDVATYAAPAANAPLVVGFETIRAQVPQCGSQWGNLGRTGNNNGSSNFGCAVNANLAAQIADPRDIVAPRAMTSPSAQRRTVVYDAYRQGQTTSAQREQLLSSARVSDVVE